MPPPSNSAGLIGDSWGGGATPEAAPPLAGARRRAPFVRCPVSHAYFEGNADRIAKEINGLPVSEGGNLVLVEPDDDGVFLALQDANGVRVVSDARLYVDLVGYEARGREQAEFLLETVMPALRERESV